MTTRPASNALQTAKRAAAKVRARWGDRSSVAALAARVGDLEAALQEQRALSLRVAQLTDIVQELLVPIADRDEQRLHHLLQHYADSL